MLGSGGVGVLAATYAGALAFAAGGLGGRGVLGGIDAGAAGGGSDAAGRPAGSGCLQGCNGAGS